MFSGPLGLAMPDLTLPNFNDSGFVQLEKESELYEIGYARFKQPGYLPLLQGGRRASRLALLYGAANLEKTGRLSSSTQSRNLEASGYAILQAGEGREATWLCLKYGPHGGGHGHPDKNHFILYSHGAVVGIDPGTHAYGSPLHKDWDKTTLAHNTLVVDGKSQSPATGKCLAFGAERGVQYAMTEAGEIYKDVRFVRTAAMLSPEVIVFIDQVRAPSAHQYDLAYHQAGKWSAADGAGAKQWTCDLPGYSRLSQCTARALPAEGLSLQTRADGNRDLRITLASAAKSEVISGYGLWKTTQDLVPMLIQRQQGTEATFVWAVSLDGSKVGLSLAPVRSANKELPSSIAAAVQVKSGEKAFTILVNPDKQAVSVGGAEEVSTAAVSIVAR
jgi:hypothetical protein